MSKRFPGSMKKLREKFPQGLLVQARLLTDTGVVVEWEGLVEGGFTSLMQVVNGQRSLREGESLTVRKGG